MIVVTGATGNVGRPLVRMLADAGREVRAISRSIGPEDVPPGVGIRRADLARPRELAGALTGAETLFMLTSGEFFAAAPDPDEVVGAIRDAGVRRIVMLSSQGVGTGRHETTFEDAVRGSGLSWTILRPGGFASNAAQWAPSVREHRIVAAPFADIALPVIDPDDIAAVAAAALLGDGHEGLIHELTGPVAISPREQAAVIGEVIGEPVRLRELSRAQASEAMRTFMPEPVVEATLAILGSPNEAERRVSPAVERVLGRPARPFADWVRRHRALFAGSGVPS